MLKAVLFDMDGLMFDTERLTAKIWDQLGNEFGYGKVSAIMPETMGVRSDLSGEIFYRRFGQNFPYDKFIEKTKILSTQYVNEHGIPLMPGLFQLLEYLKASGLATAVATSTSRKRAMMYLNKAAVIPYFNKIICGDMVEKSKPDPDIYLKTAAALNIEPQECAVLEDSPNGAAAGIAAGMKTIMVPGLAEPDEKLRRSLFACVKSLLDVIPVIKKLQSSSAEGRP